MPRATDYQKCVMYAILHRGLGLEYIGHTTNFIARKSAHKLCCIDNNLFVYKTIRENGGWEEWEMVLISEYPCENLTQARIEEERLRKERGSTLNSYKAYTSKEEHKEYYEKYREEHKEEHKEYYKKYREEHKEYFKTKDEKYYEEHKEELTQKQKEHYEKNKEKINETIKCECGANHSRQNKSRHLKTPKHFNFVQSKNILSSPIS
jgi:hypothetical protein